MVYKDKIEGKNHRQHTNSINWEENKVWMHEVVFIPNKESYRGVKASGNAPAGRFKNVIAPNKTMLMLKT